MPSFPDLGPAYPSCSLRRHPLVVPDQQQRRFYQRTLLVWQRVSRSCSSAFTSALPSLTSRLHQDDVPGFAPSLKTMLANFNGSYEAGESRGERGPSMRRPRS